MAESGISQVIQSEAVVSEHTGRDAYTPFGVTWLCAVPISRSNPAKCFLRVWAMELPYSYSVTGPP